MTSCCMFQKGFVSLDVLEKNIKKNTRVWNRLDLKVKLLMRRSADPLARTTDECKSVSSVSNTIKWQVGVRKVVLPIVAIWIRRMFIWWCQKVWKTVRKFCQMVELVQSSFKFCSFVWPLTQALSYWPSTCAESTGSAWHLSIVKMSSPAQVENLKIIKIVKKTCMTWHETERSKRWSSGFSKVIVSHHCHCNEASIFRPSWTRSAPRSHICQFEGRNHQPFCT